LISFSAFWDLKDGVGAILCIEKLTLISQLEVNRLQGELEKIKKEVGNKDNSFKPFIKPASNEESQGIAAAS
jgi:hypothetical protein